MKAPIKFILISLAILVFAAVGLNHLKTISAKNTIATNASRPSVESTLTIQKIGVRAPIIYEPSLDEAAVEEALKRGVVHYGNTAMPGTSNAVLFGHSSEDSNVTGDYKFVFVLLHQLKVGDEVTLTYQEKTFSYEVTDMKIVKPTEVSVLKPTPQSTLTLITCDPPGLSTNRLIVTAKQVDVK